MSLKISHNTGSNSIHFHHQSQHQSQSQPSLKVLKQLLTHHIDQYNHHTKSSRKDNDNEYDFDNQCVRLAYAIELYRCMNEHKITIAEYAKHHSSWKQLIKELLKSLNTMCDEIQVQHVVMYEFYDISAPSVWIEIKNTLFDLKEEIDAYFA